MLPHLKRNGVFYCTVLRLELPPQQHLPLRRRRQSHQQWRGHPARQPPQYNTRNQLKTTGGAGTTLVEGTVDEKSKVLVNGQPRHSP